MALQNDDWDIRKTWLFTEAGNNGDFYITIAEERDSKIATHNIRVTTSGSRYPTEVMRAVSNLHRTLERYGLNAREFKRELEFKMNAKPID